MGMIVLRLGDCHSKRNTRWIYPAIAKTPNDCSNKPFHFLRLRSKTKSIRGDHLKSQNYNLDLPDVLLSDATSWFELSLT